MLITPVTNRFNTCFKSNNKISNNPILVQPIEDFNEANKGYANLTDEQIETVNKTKLAPEGMSFVPEQVVKQSYSWHDYIIWFNTGNYVIMHNSAIKLAPNKALEKMETEFLPEGYKVVKDKSGKVFAIRIQSHSENITKS